ncbi:hypothetical protein [Sulfuricurvum sp.]|uniref:hypothetical protein n=1 Tax=Sulfuricurvum sp. TaxID=2025608 RepID=UPI0026350FAD|nr:hypothetical protein [Sulfuricurvum sp.]MDD3596137.1 hypothetical protein [Sulfuricurvum sp.]
MHYAKSLLALSLASALCADTLPINETITTLYGHYGSGWVQTKQIDTNTISVYTPNRGAITHLRRDMERICLVSGGNVYMKIVDSFGDNVMISGFDANVIGALSPAQRERYIEFSPEDKAKYVISRDETEKLYSKAREKKAFLGSDDYFMTTPKYDTVCKNTMSDQTIYTTKQSDPNTFEITLDPTKTSIRPTKHSNISIDEYMHEYIKEKKEGKLLLNLLSGSKYPQMVQSYCDEAGGVLYVNTREYRSPAKLESSYDSVACLNINEPFMLEPFGGKGYLITKNKMPTISKGQVVASASNDPFSSIAVAVSSMPIGAQSETNIGNRKLVSTVYSDTGVTKLVNIQEIGGSNTYRNYKVENNQASDITDTRFVYSNIKLPSSIQNAKNSLIQQCSQYAAGKVLIDGYTAICSRQAYGNQCSVNLIYMRNDQFAGREAVNCK